MMIIAIIIFVMIFFVAIVACLFYKYKNRKQSEIESSYKSDQRYKGINATHDEDRVLSINPDPIN